MSLVAGSKATQPTPDVKPAPRKKRRRKLRCDCGQPAVVVMSVRVGSDPQYTVQLPLCAECLELERELHGEYSS